VISVAAGIGEELLFRGAVQAEWGLVLSSILFGAMHISGTGTVAFGAWAAGAGFVLGGLATVTGGLFAPIVAHATYDAIAILQIRWGIFGPVCRR
jgi:uncharacterized protein